MTCLRTVLILLALAAVSQDSFALSLKRQAKRAFSAAQKAERKGDTLQAFLLYAKAAKLQPKNAAYAARQQALQIRAAAGGETNPQDSSPEPVRRSIAEQIALGELSPAEMAEGREAVAPPHLFDSGEPRTINLRGDGRTVIEQAAKAFGLEVAFENDYVSSPQVILRMDDAHMQDVLRMLEDVTGSFFVPVTDRLFLAERDTPQRRADTSPVMAVMVPIPERFSIEEAQEIVQAVQQTFEIRRISVDPRRRVVFFRDHAADAMAARQLFYTLARLKAQVTTEVEFVSAARSSSLSYGLTTATSMPLIDFGKVLGSTVTSFAGFTRFLTFGGGSTFLGLGIANAQMLATVTKSSAQSLLTSQVTSLDGQAGQLHVGDRYPIIVNGYYGDSTGTGQVYTPPPTVNFQDLGLVLKVTPSVHEGGEVSLEIEAEYNILGQATTNNIPVISRRKFNGKVRLADGQTAVVAGLVKTAASENRDGLWGLHRIPLIGRFFRSNTVQTEDTQVLLMLRPHVVNQAPWEDPAPVLWVGSETKPLTLF